MRAVRGSEKRMQSSLLSYSHAMMFYISHDYKESYR
jgi:hypothetical protein